MELKNKLNKAINKIKVAYKKTRQSDVGDLHRVYRIFLKELPKISHLKNIVLFSGIATMLIFVLFAQRFTALSEYLPVKPISGGLYKEGVVGQIKQLNPLFASVNSAEEAAVSLMYSGLIEKGDDRNIYSNMAEKWEISNDGKEYTFYLKDNIYWHDGEKLTADDVLFTIETIQNPDTESPLQSTWSNVKVSINGEREIKFTLQQVYAPFIYNCDVLIIPRHIFEKTPVEDLRFSEISLKPIGSGPYIFDEFIELKESQEVHMTVNKNYYGKVPYIDKLVIKSYPNYQSLTGGYTKREVSGMERVISPDLRSIDKFPNLSLYNLSTPQYDVLCYNIREQSKMNDINLREAISLVIDRNNIVEKIYNDYAIPIYSPILPSYLGYNKEIKYERNIEAARKKLADANYEISESGLLRKNGQEINLRLLTSDDFIQKREADHISEMISQLGIKVSIESYPFSVLSSEFMAARDFDMLLMSQNLGPDSDIYAFYHSTQKDDPGINFSGISERELDKYIEQARTTHDTELRKSKYISITKIIDSRKIAAYLVWPNYVYGVSKEIKGLDSQKLAEPKNRFWNIENWYILSSRSY